MTTNFPYKPLDISKNEIRLLRLLPLSHHKRKGINLNTICCTLKTVCLTNPGPYKALSYTWGEPTFSKRILINDNEVFITENLDSALRHLQHESKTLSIWIDALCINQRDLRGKEDQVGTMREVYQLADHVLIWLGPAADRSDELLDTFLKIGQTYEILRLLSSIGIAGSKLVKGTGTFVGLYQIPGHEPGLEIFMLPLKAIKAFAERPWWSRVWVIQEVSVAQHTTFICGKKTVSVEYLENAVNGFMKDYMTKAQIDQKLDMSIPRLNWTVDGPKYMSSMISITSMLIYREKFQHRPPSRSRSPPLLLSLLSGILIHGKKEFPQLKSIDERDKIYALLGLAADRDELNIRVDYSENYTVAALYLDVSKTLLEHQYLKLLGYQPRKYEPNGTPSWACDWSASINAAQSRFCCELIGKRFPASGSSKALIHFPEDSNGKILKLMGIHVDKIARVGTPLELNQEDIWKDVIRDCWFQLGTFIQQAENIWQDRPKAVVARILTSDVKQRSAAGFCSTHVSGWYQRSRPQHCTKGFRELKNCLRLMKDISTIQEGGGTEERTLYAISILWAMFDPAWEEAKWYTYALLTQGSFDKCPFRSREGYAGLGPSTMEADDVIVVFLGADMPYVLRPVERGMFRILGEAYVNTIMDGEVMAGKTATKFRIC